MVKVIKKTDEVLFDDDELLALAKHDLDKGEVESALFKLKQVLVSDEPLDEARTMAARIYAQLGLFERAQGLYEEYIAKNPGAVLESFQLGMTFFDMGRVEEALSHWDKVLDKEPVHPPSLFYKGLVLAQLGKVADAKQSLDTLLKSAPADNLYFGRARELLQAIDSGQVVNIARNDQSAESTSAALPQDAYKVEH